MKHIEHQIIFITAALVVVGCVSQSRELSIEERGVEERRVEERRIKEGRIEEWCIEERGGFRRAPV